MYYVYVIISVSKSYRYISLTGDIQRRLKQHNRGYNRTTKPYLPFKLLLVEEFLNRKDAREREKYLKSGVGRDYLNTISRY